MKRSLKRLFAAAVAAMATGVLIAPHAFAAAPLPGGTLDPRTIPKYVQPLVVPPFMPRAPANLDNIDYDIAVQQFQQRVLPDPLPLTTVWGYGSIDEPGPVRIENGVLKGSFHYPAFTIEARKGVPTKVKWRNELVADPVTCRDPLTPATHAACAFVPYFLPVDQTLHWANPPKQCRAHEMPGMPPMPPPPGPDCAGDSVDPYAGPAPIVTHLHGGHIDPDVDGYPEAWYLPKTTPPDPDYAMTGSNFPAGWPVDGTATYEYRNDQKGTTLWYHDHALGLTRTNVYTGMAGFYFLRDAYENDLVSGTVSALNPNGFKIPSGAQEIPLAIQDRSFNADGSLFYASSRQFFDGYAGPYFPATDVPPTWNPEFFGNTMVVNGKVWPFHPTEARRYRLRFLNGTDSRFLILQFADARGRPNGLKIAIIGNDGGFLPGKVATVTQLVIGPGERYDTIVDFGPVAGTSVILQNVGPDAPWGGGAVAGGAQADPGTTGQVMRFDVALRPAGFVETATVPGKLVLKQPLDTFEPAATGTPRTLTLNEKMSMFFAGPVAAQLGDWSGAKEWMDAITEYPPVGIPGPDGTGTEVWQIINRTVDAHPIHLHQVQFAVQDRTPIDLAAWDAAVAACSPPTPGAVCPPDPMLYVARGALPLPPNPWELGGKDTVIMRPGEVTRVRAKFDIPGLYVWHCHILSHEDNEMMRPYCVGPVGSCQP
jgi:FtsP/CotA-like multicopper oxidase with cupredoxin domain